jgi:cell division septum initiation protein DivIVA
MNKHLKDTLDFTVKRRRELLEENVQLHQYIDQLEGELAKEVCANARLRAELDEARKVIKSAKEPKYTWLGADSGMGGLPNDEATK